MMAWLPMNDNLADPQKTGAALAGKAANWALGMAIASIACAGTGIWLALNFGLGIIPLLLGMLGWTLCLAAGLGFAMGALKLSYGISSPGQVRKKAWGAIGVSAFSLALVVVYVFALAVAVQQLAQ
jgi:hypothetical protein